MKKLSFLAALTGLVFCGAASAADITVYYSPTCPHCHNARGFISNTLIYEYPELKVTEVNATDIANADMFQNALKKCEYESGGVPVLVIGEKCFQGYAEFMNDDLRNAIEADMSDDAKAVAAENKKAMESDADAFKAAHSDRTSAISEYSASADDSDATAQKKNSEPSVAWFYGLLAALVVALGIVLMRGNKKK
ncbi:MAG: hypothetical protein IJ560_00725 [Alphaproteobacteria bacterium]|nr:hypothetical protein [Alphaproteobacteria bacterium]